LQEEIEGLQNQLELAKKEKLQAESDRMILTKELENAKKQLMTVNNKNFASFLNVFEESVEKSEEIHHLELKNARLKLECEEHQNEISELKQKIEELLEASKRESSSFKENYTKLSEAVDDSGK
jgi:predicted RNase H-like nuclease (RuvC/YqgF family)